MGLSLAVVFWALVGFAVGITSVFLIPAFKKHEKLLFVLGGIFLLLGVTLMVLTFKQGVRGMLRIFLILTGAAPVGMIVSAILHNFVYAIFIKLFGKDFWKGGDEAFFFLMALFGCPIAFVVGVVGSIVSVALGV